MHSSTDRDDQVMALMAAALTLAAEERSGYLQDACRGDEELFQDIHDALEWEERMGGFLRKPWMSLQELERPFRPGEVVNNRFEIVREVGQGGMGIVYEALDRKRGQRIAIKSAKLGFRRLLSPELESALKVRHPNVCLVNEIHTAATEHGDIDFLTMEFLEGSTLQAKLASGGRLPPEEALEIVRQLCAGLAEAHRIGIIHKDLKPANIIVSELPDGGPRVVITDFGLAGEPALGSGDLAGTPHYMAPELWRGEPASKATDLYALGVIAYEMLTGGTPFGDEPSQARLTVRPPPPSTGTAGLDRRWDAVILRCLDPSPARRPRDATEVLASLTKRSIRKAPMLAAVAIVLTLAGLAMRDTFRGWLQPPNIRLAILPIGGEADPGGNGALLDVADRLAQRKGAPTVVVIPASRSEENGVRTPEEAKRILDATHALQLTLRHDGNDLVVRGAVIDLSTHIRLQEISGRYPKAAVGDLSDALTGAVSQALDLRDVAAEEPISTAAAAPYFQGLFYLRRDQHSFDEAIPLFRKAAAIDPGSPLPPAGVAEAMVLKHQETNDLGWLAEADRALQAARALNPDSVAVLIAAGRLEFVKGGDYEQALRHYQRVAELRPRSLEVWLRIAETDDKLGLREEAIESYQKAIDLDPGYYETYEEFGVFYWGHAEYANAAEQFREVIKRAPRFYNAYTNLGAVLSEMGDDVPAEQALRASLKMKKTSGALNSLGALRAYQKRDAEALVFYKDALALNPRSYILLTNLGDSSRREGLQREAADYYQRGRDIASAGLQTDPKNGVTRAYFAYFAARLGDQTRGEQEIEQALQFSAGKKVVIRRAVLTYEMLGRRDRALQIAAEAKPNVLPELNRHPDLAGFRQDSRFRELKLKRERGG